MLYSASSGGFYSRKIHGDKVPDDVTSEADWQFTYAELIEGQAQGKRIVGDENGFPALQDPPPPLPATREQIEAERLRAYADPMTGSDRYFAEAQRESLIGNAEAAEAAKVLGLARFAEIQAEHPWPAE